MCLSDGNPRSADYSLLDLFGAEGFAVRNRAELMQGKQIHSDEHSTAKFVEGSKQAFDGSVRRRRRTFVLA
jgi:hypothetical protein